MVVMTLRLPRRSRMSQVRPGGWLRVLVELAVISTVIGDMAGLVTSGLECRWAAGLRTRQGGAARVEGKLL